MQSISIGTFNSNIYAGLQQIRPQTNLRYLLMEKIKRNDFEDSLMPKEWITRNGNGVTDPMFCRASR